MATLYPSKADRLVGNVEVDGRSARSQALDAFIQALAMGRIGDYKTFMAEANRIGEKYYDHVDDLELANHYVRIDSSLRIQQRNYGAYLSDEQLRALNALPIDILVDLYLY